MVEQERPVTGEEPSGARGPLHGLRVIEAATLAAGPTVATALGEFGAEVIKVEPPGAGDPMRTWGDRRDGIGLVWKSIGRNKRSVTLDLREPAGRRVLHRLLDVADVLVVGNRPSALARWGLDFDSVHAAHPHVVVAHITGYGHGGPKSDRPGYGTLAEAMSGFAQVTGEADGPPTLPPFMLADGVAAAWPPTPAPSTPPGSTRRTPPPRRPTCTTSPPTPARSTATSRTARATPSSCWSAGTDGPRRSSTGATSTASNGATAGGASRCAAAPSRPCSPPTPPCCGPRSSPTRAT
ncbi:CoA transferase [Actinomadura sp. OS1-43]|nr:CoA transferase [Actinomadura sp. OS1-43]MDL4816323.1 CoA transferase [Actinomadura sp. OS1-43]